MNTISPININLRAYPNNTEHYSSLRAINISQEEDKFTPSFKGYDKGLGITGKLGITALLTWFTGLFSQKTNKTEEAAQTLINEAVITTPKNKETSKQETVNDVPYKEYLEKATSIDSEFVSELTQHINKNTIKEAPLTNYMIYKVVELKDLEKDPENAVKLLNILFKYSSMSKDLSQLTPDDIDYIKEQVISNPSVIKYKQENIIGTIKVLKMYEKDPVFTEEYAKKFLINVEYPYIASDNLYYIDKVYEMKKNNYSAYAALMASKFFDDAEEMLQYPNYTEKSDEAIEKVNKIVNEVFNYVDDDDYDIELGLLYEKYPELVEKIIRELRIIDVDVVNKIIEKNGDPDFLDYMQYEGEQHTDDAEKYAEKVKRFKPIIDSIIDTEKDPKEQFSDKCDIIFDYEEELDEFGDYMIQDGNLPKTQEELDDIIAAYQRYPDIIITPKIVELCKFDFNEMFDIPAICNAVKR